jgi:hypothetical protein
MTIYGAYDPYLVALSISVACLASYTALDLGGRISGLATVGTAGLACDSCDGNGRRDLVDAFHWNARLRYADACQL